MTKDVNNLNEMEQKISSLVTYRSSLVNELKRFNQRRHELYEEIVNLKEKENKERVIRSEKYDLINQLKDARKEILFKIDDVRNKLDKIDDVFSTFEKKIPKTSKKEITENLRKIEWKLQTERLTRNEEKELVEYIKKLELELHIWKKAYIMRQELLTLQTDASELREKLDEITDRKNVISSELKIHKENLKKFKMLRQQLIDEDKEVEYDISELQENLDRTDEELFNIREKKRECERISKESKEKRILEESLSKVKDKLKNGKSLSWNELKIFYEENK